MRKFLFSIISLAITAISVYLSYLYFSDFTLFIIFVSVASVFFAVSIVLFMLFLNTKKVEKIKWLENRLNVWNSISHHVSAAGDEAFTNLAIGILVFDHNLEVKWANDYAKRVFHSNLINASLDTISPVLVDEINNGKNHMLITAFNKSFDVEHNIENRILYFFDVTEREETLKRYHNRITAFGIIAIDNLDESLKRYDMQEQTTIRGQILGVISDWLNTSGCSLQTLDDDRMFVVLDQEALRKMIEDKFSILTSVREIANKNHLKAT